MISRSKKAPIKKGAPAEGPPFSEPVQFKRTLAAAQLALNDMRTLHDTVEAAQHRSKSGGQIVLHAVEARAILENIAGIMEALREGTRGKF